MKVIESKIICRMKLPYEGNCWYSCPDYLGTTKEFPVGMIA